MNILILNHLIANCGVYQYGKRFAANLVGSTQYNFTYREVSKIEDLYSLIEQYNPNIIIFNYLEGTMPWFQQEHIQKIRSLGCRLGTIVHNSYFPYFDFYLHQNPYHLPVSNSNFALPRPLFSFEPPKIQSNDQITIGSFGFPSKAKLLPFLCKTVQAQLSSHNVQINLHLPKAHFGETDVEIKNIVNDCFREIISPNIKLQITQDFMSDLDVLNFLYRNDLNMFLYQDYNFYNGIASSTDYALSVKKPIAICKTNMFSHITTDEILIEKTPLLTIINNGFSPLEKKYQEWTNPLFTKKIELIMDQVI